MLLKLLFHFTLLFAISLHTAQACDADEDCSLNGLCLPTPSNNTVKSCVCDQGWAGDDCARLDLSPATRNTGYNHTEDKNPGDFGPYGNSSWGGTILQDPTNSSVFHLFTSQFDRGCGLSGWRPHSYIMRAESYDGPQGPYHWTEAVTKSFRHNPHVIFSPTDRKYLMYSIGVDAPKTDKCESITYKQWPNNISVASADNLRGPWSDWKVIVKSDVEGQELRATNPSPFALWSIDDPTSAIALGIKDYNIFVAGRWNQTYSRVYKAEWDTTEHGFSNPYWTEDTFIWRDKRGHWHSLAHWMIDLVERNLQQWPRVGVHLYARNLTGPWHFAAQPAFTSNVSYTDGSWELLKRRERPKLYFSDDGEMTPLYLVTGVQAMRETAKSYTHIQPVGTKWEDYEKGLKFR